MGAVTIALIIFFTQKEKMQIKILVSNATHLGIKKNDVVYVSKTKYTAGTQYFGVKADRGLVWFKASEIEEVTVDKV